MKNIILLMLLLFAVKAGIAQPYIAEKIFDLPDYEKIQSRWGDVDGDGLLDLVVFAHGADQTAVYCLVQQDSTSFSFVQLTIGEQAGLNFQLKDFDHDGHLDIIYVAGNGSKSIVIALNNGNLSFSPTETDFQADEFILNDVDKDGDEDIIASANVDAESRRIYLIENDTVLIEGAEIEGLTLVTGESFIENQKVHCVVRSSEEMNQLGFFIFEKGALFFEKSSVFPNSEVYQFGDLNHDGRVDVVVAVEQQIAIIYRNGNEYEVDEIQAEGLEISHIDIGDVDLDGLADIVFTSIFQQQAILFFYKNEIENGDQPDSAFFELNHGFINELADINDDGDLDLASMISEDSGLSFYVQLNQSNILNVGPEPINIFPPVTIYDETLFSWHKTTDDHTDTLAISYELFIEYDGSDTFHTMPGYDMDTTTRVGFRNVVGHGYQWFDREYKAKSLENGRYYWGVVGVDNAYYASSDIRDCKGKGPCIDFYTPINCFDLLVEDTVVCYNSILTVDLQSGNDTVKWYSVKKGFLEYSPILELQVLEPDTIYGIYFPQIPCGEETDECVLNYSIAIDVEKPEEELFVEMEFCPEAENNFAIEGEWDSVRWWYDEKIVWRETTIILDSIPEKPVVAEAFRQNVCPVYDTLELVEIERLLDPASLPDSIQACIGQATQIDVFGELNLEHFLFSWNPGDLFDEPDLPNPFITTTNAEPVTVIVTQDKCYSDTIPFAMKLLPLPEITTNGDQEIFRGEKVLLIAEGAEVYRWSPEDDLQSPNSGTTWGEPPATITYTVKGTDSEGCYAESFLQVAVKNSVFIPDLFSPNGDGRNDYLHVYGEGIGTLSFRVFDERGSLMAELDENSNAAGWDGLVSGNELPSGTYFWTVSGEFIDGSPINYQGKNKGSIRLMR